MPAGSPPSLYYLATTWLAYNTTGNALDERAEPVNLQRYRLQLVRGRLRQRFGLRDAAVRDGAPAHGLRGGLPGTDRRAPVRGCARLRLGLQGRLPVRAQALPLSVSNMSAPCAALLAPWTLIRIQQVPIMILRWYHSTIPSTHGTSIRCRNYTTSVNARPLFPPPTFCC